MNELHGSSSSWREAQGRVLAGADAREEARGIIELMTTTERLDMLDGGLPFWRGLGDIVTGSIHKRPFPAAVLSRLGIPGLWFADGPRGAVIGPATAFPVPMARGATFNPDLEERVGDAIGAEVLASGATLFGGVCINLLRHLSWGRAQETYSEDPYLLSRMGVAAVRGTQRHLMATVKHFALNSMENSRFSVDVDVDLATLHEVYLPHFEAAIDAGAACVMTAYNSVNGEWCGESHLLIEKILRGSWNFDGYVISDWILGLRDGVKSLRAGLDVEMPYRMIRRTPIDEAIANGTLSTELVDRACENILSTLLRFNVPEPHTQPQNLATPAHRSLAREVASASFVLLHNDHAGAPLLPFASGAATSVALFGSLASRINLGDAGSSDVYTPDPVTFADGLRERFSRLSVNDGHDINSVAEIAGAHDVAVVVVGSTKDDEGEYISEGNNPELARLMPGPDDDALVENFEKFIHEKDWPLTPGYGRGTSETFGTGGDRSTLELKESDLALIEAVAAANSRTVVVVMGATASLVHELTRSVAGILLVFYPGVEGGRALADVLLGDSEPAGRLPFALPGRASDLVEFNRETDYAKYGPLHGQWHLDHEGHTAAFPFGYGLGWGPLEIIQTESQGDAITVTLKNNGDLTTNSIIFAHARASGSSGPRKLACFVRMVIQPQEILAVTMLVDRWALRRFNPETQRLESISDSLDVEIGRWARDSQSHHLTLPAVL